MLEVLDALEVKLPITVKPHLTRYNSLFLKDFDYEPNYLKRCDDRVIT